jgi:hypothetical protein
MSVIDNCPLCSIPQRETLIYEDDKIYLVESKDQRGHKVRVMSVVKRHTTTPTFEEQITAVGKLIEYMSNLMKDQDWYLISPKYASVPQHVHWVACDAPLEDECDPQFIKTPKVVFPIRRE